MVPGPHVTGLCRKVIDIHWSGGAVSKRASYCYTPCGDYKLCEKHRARRKKSPKRKTTGGE